MRRSVIAALLSAVVFPGAGQVYLKRRRRGYLIALVALTAALYFASQVIDPVMGLANEVLAGTLAPDAAALAARLDEQGKMQSPLNNLALVVMLVCWIGATIDAFILGRSAATAPPP